MNTANPTQPASLLDLDNAGAPPVWRLRVLYASATGIINAEAKTWDGDAPLCIGRRSASPSGDGRPWLHVADERSSREHARVFKTATGLEVEDLKSRNGTWVNGQRLLPGAKQPLLDGDVLRVGDAFILVRCEPNIADVPIPTLIGISRAACQIRRALVRCALGESAVLLLGETGTGKEVAAQALYQLSQRRGKFVAINCAAVPATLAEAQLFGTVRGAFTGATEQAGFFGEAHKGVLFLDEVGELPLDIQPKLLRALETGMVTPVGTTRTVACDVRIVSATNRDLAAAMAQKTFREDLYARLSPEVIVLPPLRERREDILLLLQHFGGADLRPSPRLVATLLAYSFPLNIREVRHVAGRLRTTSEAEVISWLESQRTPAAPSPMRTPPPLEDPTPAEPEAEPPVSPAEKPGKASLPTPIREQLTDLLERYRGNLRRIEKEHGYTRRNLRRWAERYGIDLDKYRQDQE